MIYYVSALVWLYLALFFKRRSFLYSFLFFFPLVLFAAFRGFSGKDTPAYIIRFFNFDFSHSSWLYSGEPFINLFISTGKLIDNNNPIFFFALHAIFLVILYSLVHQKKQESLIYLIVLGPVFLVDGLVNGMRVTLAYHLFLVAYLYRKKILYIPMVLSHFSSFLFLGLNFVSFFFDSRYLKYFYALFSVLLAYTLVDGYLGDYFLKKLEVYQKLSAVNVYSGVSDLIVLWFFGFVILVERLRSVLLSAFLMLFTCIAYWFLIQESVFFIRVLKIIIIFLSLQPGLQGRFMARSKVAYYVLGLGYVINFLRQVYMDSGFLPYGGF
jgi:hypothetical protein